MNYRRSPEHGPPPSPESRLPQQPEQAERKMPGGDLLPEHLLGRNLNVLRSSGEMDIGAWTVERAKQFVDEETGDKEVLVTVTAPAPESSPHDVLQKKVWLTDLKQWNQPPEQDDISNELVATPAEINEALGRDNLDDEPVASPEELRAVADEARRQHEVGSTALAGTGAEGPRHMPKLIDKVPNADELRARQEAESVEAENRLREQLKSMVEGLNESDRLNVAQYSMGLVKKREAQFRDDGAGSTMHEQRAGQARRALSPDGLEVVDQYHDTNLRIQNLQLARRKGRR